AAHIERGCVETSVSAQPLSFFTLYCRYFVVVLETDTVKTPLCRMDGDVQKEMKSKAPRVWAKEYAVVYD
ncbi:hypothetical protein, partial [Bacteroides heparinolyticus]|uniref:hypothetical protein n=1 Tax=Prevotella heparinolytica TaxID=28113 RepID=UPI00359F75C4